MRDTLPGSVTTSSLMIAPRNTSPIFPHTHSRLDAALLHGARRTATLCRSKSRDTLHAMRMPCTGALGAARPHTAGAERAMRAGGRAARLGLHPALASHVVGTCRRQCCERGKDRLPGRSSICTMECLGMKLQTACDRRDDRARSCARCAPRPGRPPRPWRPRWRTRPHRSMQAAARCYSPISARRSCAWRRSTVRGSGAGQPVEVARLSAAALHAAH